MNQEHSAPLPRESKRITLRIPETKCWKPQQFSYYLKFLDRFWVWVISAKRGSCPEQCHLQTGVPEATPMPGICLACPIVHGARRRPASSFKPISSDPGCLQCPSLHRTAIVQLQSNSGVENSMPCWGSERELFLNYLLLKEKPKAYPNMWHDSVSTLVFFKRFGEKGIQFRTWQSLLLLQVYLWFTHWPWKEISFRLWILHYEMENNSTYLPGRSAVRINELINVCKALWRWRTLYKSSVYKCFLLWHNYSKL